MNKLDTFISQLEGFIPQHEISNPEISEANVGWHIEHSLLVLNGVVEALKNSDPKDYKWKFNFVRWVIMTTKTIPRGKGKAPKTVRPLENFDSTSLQAHVLKTNAKIKEVSLLPEKANFKHPYFGLLKRDQTIKFLEIHTKHHLKIIGDIVK